MMENIERYKIIELNGVSLKLIASACVYGEIKDPYSTPLELRTHIYANGELMQLLGTSVVRDILNAHLPNEAERLLDLQEELVLHQLTHSNALKYRKEQLESELSIINRLLGE